MAANRTEPAKPEAERSEKPAAAAADAAGAAAKSPLQAWLPMIVAIVLLPVVAWLVTSFVLLPKLQKGLGVAAGPAPAAASAHAPAKESGGHGKPAAKEASGHGGGGGEHGGAEGEGADENGREQVPLTKLIVNVAGTSASRILLCSLILVGATPDFRGAIKARDAQLRDTACGILSTKTIQDLEKPGARNMIRSELITAFNHILGGAAVQEIYFAEFAIQ